MFDNDVAVIAVMGATGTGKTTVSNEFEFINLVSHSTLPVSNSLKSCTNVVQPSLPFYMDGRKVMLIDTPGFDDTTISDTEVLTMIAVFLSTTYEHGKTLAGVIYMHRISDYKLGGIAARNFRMFRQLCGEETLKNVVIVTNMWGDVSLEVGEVREVELATQDNFFKPVLDKKAQLVRHENTSESAEAVLRHLIGNEPTALRIQRELIDEGKDISHTAAGEEITRELMLQMQRHQEGMRSLEKEMAEAVNAKDMETMDELKEDIEKLHVETLRIRNDLQRMADGYAEERAIVQTELQKALGSESRASALEVDGAGGTPREPDLPVMHLGSIEVMRIACWSLHLAVKIARPL